MTNHYIMLSRALGFLLLTLLVLSPNACGRTIVKRDEHSLVIPLAYEPSSNLMTASIDIGTPSSQYNLIVDTGSPFLVIQNSSFHTTSSTFDPRDAGQPDMSGATGYITTDPNASDQQAVKPTMHFVTDKAYLVEASGQRAGGASKAGNVTVGLTHLNELKSGGILGISPPFSKVGQGFGKQKREQGSLPSLDVSFLHSYLSPEHLRTLGVTGSAHFYLSFTPPTPETPVPRGELVFPLTGTTLPNVEGYDFAAGVTIDPNSGSTFPRKPFWGIAHRDDLKFYLDAQILADVRIDAILLDSGTSGIVGPPSEVDKIFAATNQRVTTTPGPPNSGAVLGKADCSSALEMGFEIGAGKRVGFESIRRTVARNGQFSQSRRDATLDTTPLLPFGEDGLGLWKSYIDFGTQAYANGIHQWLDGWTTTFDFWHRLLGKRHLRKRRLAQLEPQESAAAEEKCTVSLVGSKEVEKMFPSNGPDFKVWILGMEFFQRNLVYHNVDTAVTVIVPRK